MARQRSVRRPCATAGGGGLGDPGRVEGRNRRQQRARATLSSHGVDPNPAILLTAIPLLEAQASSEIENIVTTADELFRRADDEAGADPATRETLRYRAALQTGVEQAVTRGVTAATAAMVCSIIHGRDMSVRAARHPDRQSING